LSFSVSQNSIARKLGIVVCLGPGPRDVERTRDLLEAVRIYEPNTAEIVLIDDGKEDRRLETAYAGLTVNRLTSLRASRQGNAPGLLGGLCENLLQAYRFITSQTDVDYVLRLDTDAMICAPVAKRLQAELERAGAKTGILGCVDCGPSGERRPLEPWNKVSRGLASRIALWPRSPHVGNFSKYVSIALSRTRRTIRDRIRLAFANGYVGGVAPMGGAYALSRKLLDAMAQRGYLDDGHLWREIHMSEDALFAIYAFACGFTLADSHRGGSLEKPGDLFAVEWQYLHAHPLDIIEAGYAVAHSVKSYGPLGENEIRAAFRAARNCWQDEKRGYATELLKNLRGRNVEDHRQSQAPPG
jgi:hypothetical protein